MKIYLGLGNRSTDTETRLGIRKRGALYPYKEGLGNRTSRDTEIQCVIAWWFLLTFEK